MRLTSHSCQLHYIFVNTHFFGCLLNNNHFDKLSDRKKRSEKQTHFRPKIFSDKVLLRELCLEKLTVEAGDVVDGDAFWTFHFTGAGVGAVAEAEFFHLCDHIPGPSGSLWTTLREQSEGTYPCGHKQHRRAVFTGCNAGTATYAGGSVHALLSVLVRDKNVVGILGGTSSDRDESSSLKDLVESAAVNNQVLDYRKSSASERLYSDGSAILEVTHEKLTGGDVIVRTVRATVNEQRAGTADTLAAVVVERHRTAALAASVNGYWIVTLTDQLLIEDVKHFEERGVLLYSGNMISLKMTLFLGVLLTPYLKIEIHSRF